jgi:hypothetical protein
MTFKARKRLAMLVLVVGLPLYIVAAISLVGLLPRPNRLLELGIYVGLGLIWALPLRRLFLGVARAEPGQDGKKDAE